MKIHHIGYLVKRIEQAISEFKKLGFELENLSNGAESVAIDDIRKIKIAFMLNGSYRIELVEPLDKTSPIPMLILQYWIIFHFVIR